MGVNIRYLLLYKLMIGGRIVGMWVWEGGGYMIVCPHGWK